MQEKSKLEEFMLVITLAMSSVTAILIMEKAGAPLWAICLLGLYGSAGIARSIYQRCARKT